MKVRSSQVAAYGNNMSKMQIASSSLEISEKLPANLVRITTSKNVFNASDYWRDWWGATD